MTEASYGPLYFIVLLYSFQLSMFYILLVDPNKFLLRIIFHLTI